MSKLVVLERRVPRRSGAAAAAAVRRTCPTTQLLSYGVPAEWLHDVRQADRGVAARTCRPPARGGGRGAAGAGDRRDASNTAAVGRRPGSIRSSIPTRSVASVSCSKCRGARTRARLSLGASWMVFLHPAQRAARRARLQWSGACLGLGRHGQDDRRSAPRRVSSAGESRRAGCCSPPTPTRSPTRCSYAAATAASATSRAWSRNGIEVHSLDATRRASVPSSGGRASSLASRHRSCGRRS